MKQNDSLLNLRYSTLRLKRITNLVFEGFSWVKAIEIRNFEEGEPNHFQPKSWKDRLTKNKYD